MDNSVQPDKKPPVLAYFACPEALPGWRGCPPGAWIGILGGWCFLAAAIANALMALGVIGPISANAEERIVIGFFATVPIAAVLLLVGLAKLEKTQRRHPGRSEGAGLFVAGAVGGTISALAAVLLLMALLASVL